MLYYENLYVNNFTQIRIIEFSLEQKISCHSYAYIKAELYKDAVEAIMSWKDYEPMAVSDKESGHNLFAGIIKQFKIYWEHGTQMIRMKLVSGTYLLDLEKKKISYQKRQSYRELVESVIADKAMMAYLTQERAVPNLLVQYEETDWRFIDRLASHLKTCVIPEINALCVPQLYFGIRKGIHRGEIEPFSYREGMDSRFHSEKTCNKNAIKQDYVYYQITGYENFDIGDYLTFQGQLWRVGEKSARLKDNVMEFAYRLAKETCFRRQPVFNPGLHGKEIQGVVKKRERELLQIALEIDKDEKEQDTFFYQWMPECGTLLYCMPEIGEQVTLYFSSDDENDAICINSTRNNDEFPLQQWNHDHKQFLTHGYERMELRKEQMEIRNMDSYISIDEKQGISVCTEKAIQIQSAEQVKVKTRKINVKAEQEIDMIREDIFTPTMIILKEDINAKGGELKTEPNIQHDDKTIPERIFNKGKDLDNNSRENDAMGMLARR